MECLILLGFMDIIEEENGMLLGGKLSIRCMRFDEVAVAPDETNVATIIHRDKLSREIPDIRRRLSYWKDSDIRT